MSITIIPYLAFFTFRPTDQILLRSSIKLFSITDIAAGIVATGVEGQQERDYNAPEGARNDTMLDHNDTFLEVLIHPIKLVLHAADRHTHNLGIIFSYHLIDIIHDGYGESTCCVFRSR